MMTCSTARDYCTLDWHSDAIWQDLYPVLRSFAHRLVFSLHVPCWQGQEDDVAEDIVQETVYRLMEYIQRVEQGEAIAIVVIERFMKVVASNYARDLRRRDLRLMRMSSENDAWGDTMARDPIDPAEEAIENVYQEWFFTQVARIVADFPTKQRKALLTDIANHTHFDQQPTPLQTAFLNVGIRLQDYQHPLPKNRAESGRHSVLLSIARKRLARLMREQKDMLMSPSSSCRSCDTSYAGDEETVGVRFVCPPRISSTHCAAA
jgi:DNA-directed RNA polymerase specialized sigma24 family protein